MKSDILRFPTHSITGHGNRNKWRLNIGNMWFLVFIFPLRTGLLCLQTHLFNAHFRYKIKKKIANLSYIAVKLVAVITGVVIISYRPKSFQCYKYGTQYYKKFNLPFTHHISYIVYVTPIACSDWDNLKNRKIKHLNTYHLLMHKTIRSSKVSNI